MTGPGRPRLAVVYVYPVGEPLYDERATRFVETYREYPPGYEHSLHVMLNGEGPVEQNIARFDGLEVEFHRHDGRGWDIGAYQKAARELDCDVMVCLGGHTYFRRSGWLERMMDAFRLHGDGLYGASASLSPRAHIRTTGFWCDPALISAYGQIVSTKDERYAFEHGTCSITNLARHLGLGTWVVTWDEVCAEDRWRAPEDIYWRGDQSNALAYDRPFDHFDANVMARPFLSAFADGWGIEPAATAYGKTEAELRAEVYADRTEDKFGADEGPLSVLARATLSRLRSNAPDAASAQRAERELVEELGSDSMVWLWDSFLGGVGLSEADWWSPAIRRAILRSTLEIGSYTDVAEDAVIPANAWAVGQNMRLSGIRGFMLRLLRPFADRQRAQDVRTARLIALLADEAAYLSERVRELERSRADRP